MILSDPVPWSCVPVGAVVLDGDTPRAVLANGPMPPMGRDIPEWIYADLRTVLLEGARPKEVRQIDTVQLVMLDESDAMATLAAAGLTPEIIITKNEITTHDDGNVTHCVEWEEY